MVHRVEIFVSWELRSKIYRLLEAVVSRELRTVVHIAESCFVVLRTMVHRCWKLWRARVENHGSRVLVALILRNEIHRSHEVRTAITGSLRTVVHKRRAL